MGTSNRIKNPPSMGAGELIRAGSSGVRAPGAQQNSLKKPGAGGKMSVGKYGAPKGMKIEREGE